MNKRQNKETKQLKKFIKELDELSKPENMIGPFTTTEELIKSLWDDDDDDNE